MAQLASVAGRQAVIWVPLEELGAHKPQNSRHTGGGGTPLEEQQKLKRLKLYEREKERVRTQQTMNASDEAAR